MSSRKKYCRCKNKKKVRERKNKLICEQKRTGRASGWQKTHAHTKSFSVHKTIFFDILCVFFHFIRIMFTFVILTAELSEQERDEWAVGERGGKVWKNGKCVMVVGLERESAVGSTNAVRSNHATILHKEQVMITNTHNLAGVAYIFIHA